MDVQCNFCGGKGTLMITRVIGKAHIRRPGPCRFCSGTGWIDSSDADKLHRNAVVGNLTRMSDDDEPAPEDTP